MWTRKELKDKAKGAFKGNYWKSVLVALVLAAVVGGMSVYSSVSSVPPALLTSAAPTQSYAPNNVNVEIRDGKVKVDVDDDNGGKVHVDMDADDVEGLRDALEDAGVREAGFGHAAAIAGPGIVLAGLSLALAMLFVIALAIALYVFIMSPLEVGAQRFFVRNLNQRAEVKEVAFGYDNNYKEVVKTLFLRSLFIFLWALLLVIPGIYKSYQYRMIPYLLADDPTMTKDRAFAESKRMMDGQKWNTFVLDLSFLGWNILSALTLGILGVFYVTPYQAQTNAALYEKLRYGLPAPEQPVQPAPSMPVAPAPMGGAQPTVAPVIVSDAQPPIPPFAQVEAAPVAAPEVAAASEVAPTGPIPASESPTTAPLPESGIDPTAEMPAAEGDGAADSPEA